MESRLFIRTALLALALLAAAEAEPLPIQTAAALRQPNLRDSFRLSPDGRRLLHVVCGPETLERDGVFSKSGMPLTQGGNRMECWVSDVHSGHSQKLGNPRASCWSPSWSPDGTRIAYYSDEGGQAGLWIWDGQRSRRVAGLLARPYFGFESPVWCNRGLICKLVPAGKTTAQANRDDSNFRVAAEEWVKVRSSTEKVQPLPKRLFGADLALVEGGRVERLTHGLSPRYYAVSPDGRWLAYTVLKGARPSTQQPLFDLYCLDLNSRRSRRLAQDATLAYGVEWSFSPDSRQLAMIESGPVAQGQMVLYEVQSGHSRRLEGGLHFDPGDGENRPCWTADNQLVGLAEGKLWTWKEEWKPWLSLPGWNISHLVTSFDTTTLAARPCVQASNSAGEHAFFEGERLLCKPRGRLGSLHQLAHRGQTLAFVSEDQHSPGRIWSCAIDSGRTQVVADLNPTLKAEELGSTRVLPGRGSLLLPPGPPARRPLVVWVYGGDQGSDYADTYGLTGMPGEFDMQVLATRGYAVLFPDTPLRPGKPAEDLLKTVLPAVDAAIADGQVDPERLAIMGQSYGSYCTLALITRTDRFKAAVISAVLHPDLFAGYAWSPGYFEKGQGNMGGSIWEKRDSYFENSPLFQFDRVQTPVLIGQGDQDGDLSGAESVYKCLDRLHKPVEYRLYKNEGHVLENPRNVMDFWQRRLEFLAQHLDLRVDSLGAIRFENGRALPRQIPAGQVRP